MPPVSRYLVTLPGPVGGHQPQQQVVVTDSGALGPAGHAVYTDATGRIRLEINDHGVARPLSVPPGLGGPLHAEPLP